MNECGPCTECCFAMGVNELDKKANEKCGHCFKGCKIYDERPSACRHFVCTWLSSDWPKKYRPDRINAVVYSTQSGLHMHETKPGALHGKHASELKGALDVSRRT